METETKYIKKTYTKTFSENVCFCQNKHSMRAYRFLVYFKVCQGLAFVSDFYFSCFPLDLIQKRIPKTVLLE